MAKIEGTSSNDFVHVSGDGLNPPPGYNDLPDATNGRDIINGRLGDDIIYAGDGDDILRGGKGHDIVIGGLGADMLMGSPGDEAWYTTSSAAVTVDLSLATAQSGGDAQGDILEAIDGLKGSAFADTLRGNGRDNLLDGFGGADTLVGRTGADSYIVDDAGDVVTELAGQGYDRVFSSVTLGVVDNTEELHMIAGGTTANGDGASNRLFADVANVVLNGLGGDDELTASGASTLDGGAGADTMSGSRGGDTFHVDSIGDVVVDQRTGSQGGINTVISSVSFTLPDFVDKLTLTGTGNLNGTGNGGANVLEGTSGDNLLSGMAGQDTLFGGQGNDTLDGGVSVFFGQSDELHGGRGSDTFRVN